MSEHRPSTHNRRLQLANIGRVAIACVLTFVLPIHSGLNNATSADSEM